VLLPPSFIIIIIIILSIFGFKQPLERVSNHCGWLLLDGQLKPLGCRGPASSGRAGCCCSTPSFTEPELWSAIPWSLLCMEGDLIVITVKGAHEAPVDEAAIAYIFTTAPTKISSSTFLMSVPGCVRDDAARGWESMCMSDFVQ
jgi:hypothetical protein